MQTSPSSDVSDWAGRSPIDLSYSLASSTQRVEFESLGLEDGLSQVTVNCILQDVHGFMWFGTQDGLNRYDGYSFTAYRPIPEENSLTSSYIRVLYEDQEGGLWIGTDGGGLDRFDRDQNRFINYRFDSQDPHSLSNDFVRAIAPGEEGQLWIGTYGGGLNRFDPDSEQFDRYSHEYNDSNSLSNDHVWAVITDQQGAVWVGTEAGLDRLDPDTGTFTHYRSDPDDPTSLSGNIVRAIYEDQAGIIWVGTSNGLNRFDSQTGQFTRYQARPYGPGNLSNDGVNIIYQDPQGTLWVGTDWGLNRFDPVRERFTRYVSNPLDLQSLSDDSITSIYQDAEGTLWIGTLGGGVNKMPPTFTRFEHYAPDPNDSGSLDSDFVWSIYQDREGTLWVGLAGSGVDRLEPGAEDFIHYPPGTGGLSDGRVRAIYEDPQGVLWLGTGNGLYAFNRQTELFTLYTHDSTDPHNPGSDNIRTIYRDREGRLWTGTFGGGLNWMDPGSKQIVRYASNDGLDNLGNVFVWSIVEDEDGSLWIGTGGSGLNRLEPEQGQVTSYLADPDDPRSLSNNSVLVVYIDRQGTLWVGTRGGGLNRFDRESGTFSVYRVRDGLPNDVIYGILEDDEGRLWLSTNQGLSCFDPETERFRNYDVDDGLQSNEFNAGAYFQNDEGWMFFGGINGFNVFHPDDIRENEYVPPIVLTSLSQGMEQIATESALERVDAFDLHWPNNYFEFEFAALSYVHPSKNEYTYILEGFDDEWVQTGTRRHGRYTNLPAGDYTLRIRGSNNHGQWNEQGLAVEVTVVPPFWGTWWFRGTFAVLLVGGAIAGYRLRVRSVEARSRELERQVAERTEELAAVNAIAAVVSRSLDLDDVLVAALEKTLEVMSIEAGGIYLLDEEVGVLTIAAQRGFSSQLVDQIDRLKVGEGFSGHVVESGQPMVVEDASTDARLTRLAVRDEGLRSIAIAPLVSKGRILGTLFVSTHAYQAFDDEDVQLLTAIGHQIGVAVANARLFKAEQRRAEQFRAISEVGSRITSILAIDELLDQVVRLIGDTFNMYHVAIGLIEGDEIVYRVGAGDLWEDPDFQFDPECLKVGEEGIGGWVAATGESLLVRDVSQEPRYIWMRGSETRSELAVPISVKGEVIGVLDVQSDRLGAFDESDLLVLQSLADQAAIAIENARLYEQARLLAVVEERQRLARELHDSVTQALYGVTLYAEATARQLASNQVELATGHLREMKDTAQEALREMRLLIFELRPSVLESEGLVNALRTRLEAVEQRAGLGISLQVDGEETLPAGMEEGLYRIAQEALNNALKHSSARNVGVSLICDETSVVMEITDDGVGFDPSTAVEGGGLGMEGMIERATQMAGKLVIESEPGVGTKVCVEVIR